MFCLSTAHKSQNTRSWTHPSTWLAARPTACLQSPYSKHNFLLNMVEQMLDWSLTIIPAPNGYSGTSKSDSRIIVAQLFALPFPSGVHIGVLTFFFRLPSTSFRFNELSHESLLPARLHFRRSSHLECSKPESLLRHSTSLMWSNEDFLLQEELPRPE